MPHVSVAVGAGNTRVDPVIESVPGPIGPRR
jgi:hypothetical protein